jgi:hypothetical protein
MSLFWILEGSAPTARILWDRVDEGFSFGVVDRGVAGKIGRQVGGGNWLEAVMFHHRSWTAVFFTLPRDIGANPSCDRA